MVNAPQVQIPEKEDVKPQHSFDRAPEPEKAKLSPKRYCMGVDLGQANDFTAVCVVEKKLAPPDDAMFSPVGRIVQGRAYYDAVYLKRMKLGTPYDQVAKRVVDLAVHLEPLGEFHEVGQITITVDGTGVGRGIVDMIKQEMFSRRRRGEYFPQVWFRPCTITGGDSTLKVPARGDGYWSLPKRDLIFTLVAAFQQRIIRIPKDAEDRAQLIEELSNYQMKINIASGATSFQPWRDADHDDMLFALALAYWGWDQPKGQTALRVIQ